MCRNAGWISDSLSKFWAVMWIGAAKTCLWDVEWQRVVEEWDFFPPPSSTFCWKSNKYFHLSTDFSFGVVLFLLNFLEVVCMFWIFLSFLSFQASLHCVAFILLCARESRRITNKKKKMEKSHYLPLLLVKWWDVFLQPLRTSSEKHCSCFVKACECGECFPILHTAFQVEKC